MKKQLLNILFGMDLHIIFLYRCSYFCRQRLPLFGGVLATMFRHAIRVYSGCDISPTARIGKRLNMPHPIGIVIGEGVTIGDNVKIWQHVTLGSDGRKEGVFSYPVIEDDVRLFANSSVLGAVVVGARATVGAHSLVLKDVPQGATVVGVPARVIGEKGKIEAI